MCQDYSGVEVHLVIEKPHLPGSPQSLLPSDRLISSRRKCPIPVIFYFVMKVSRGCEEEEAHYKSVPWENGGVHARLRRSDRSASRCFIHSVCFHLSGF